jgi:benzodiazapine receptor
LLGQYGATLYTIQLGLNAAWMLLFFGLLRPVEASINSVAHVVTIGYLVYIWSQVDSVAASLMAIYMIWLCFVTYLSVSYGN